ncbi:RNA dependent RNA polymerase [Plasmopara viticola lesion associated ourmia-like virus 12]|uniref:RNA dependent RNA polymerase n=1 Tax=Plasmopara viticola lesion associated ourmia-like virus 12 TaxID=2686479 RepID=A0ABX6FLI0_9VIRU|nr:RNA dependent RNA polymerase [Plasmopara viticola lesion associated ourmia-like virus 12]QGY72542.1 RNA dependent RNA polymerase [Plasmopara viticola lesion associated ourmia-like virus 12]
MTNMENNETKVTPIQKLLATRWVEGGKIAARSLSPNLLQALGRLEQLRLLIQGSHGVKLPSVKRADWSLKSLKNFCDGILDRDCRCHEWRTSLLIDNHASLRVRVAVASSLFLFRKVIPQELTPEQVKERQRAYVEKMTTPQGTISGAYVRHVRKYMKRLFRTGWDLQWAKAVEAFTLPTSSCIESPRSKGGPRGLDRAKMRAEFEAFAKGEGAKLSPRTELMTIWTGGKWRLVSKFSAERSFLSPLHQIIYNHLTKKNWCLRGDAKPSEFEGFERKEGEIFVSGDYESATDNLNISLTHLMLDECKKSSLHVPEAVWAEARKALVAVFHNGLRQERGQLMGSLLSFPFLCLANFLAFKWSVPRKVPLKINGDDIVFRCSQKEAEKWFREVTESGLTVSKGKTLVAKNCFSLNSTFFLPRTDDVILCPTIRSTCLFGMAEEPLQVSGRLKGVYGGNGRVRDLLHSFALREMSKQIWSSQRSVRRGLLCQTSWRAIRWSKLRDRETFYNELVKEVPLPPKKKVWSQNAIPDGFQRVPAGNAQEKDHPDFMKEMVECCWTREPVLKEKDNSFWSAVRSNTFRYVPPCDKKFARMAGMTEKEIESYYSRETNTVVQQKRMVWVKILSSEGSPLASP